MPGLPTLVAITAGIAVDAVWLYWGEPLWDRDYPFRGIAAVWAPHCVLAMLVIAPAAALIRFVRVARRCPTWLTVLLAVGLSLVSDH